MVIDPTTKATGKWSSRRAVDEYMQAMIQQSAFIDHNKGQLDPLAKAKEIRKLPQLVDERDRADDALRQSAESMAKLGTSNMQKLCGQSRPRLIFMLTFRH
jgi:hypothetical protein